MQILILLPLSFLVVTAVPPIQEQELDAQLLSRIHDFVNRDLDRFNQDLGSGASLKSYYSHILNVLKDTQENDIILQGISKIILIDFNNVFNILLNRVPSMSNVWKNRCKQKLDTKLNRFQNDARRWDYIYDFAINWIQVRLENFPEGKTKDVLIHVQNHLQEARNSLKEISVVMQEAHDVTQSTEVNEDVINDTNNKLKQVIENNLFVKQKENAVKKLQQLINEPSFPWLSKLFTINLIP